MPPSAARRPTDGRARTRSAMSTMDELASAVDSRGHVYAAGAVGYRNGPLYLLTNASGKWVQSELAQSPRRGAINGLEIAVDTRRFGLDPLSPLVVLESVRHGLPARRPKQARRCVRHKQRRLEPGRGLWHCLTSIDPDGRTASAVRDGNIHVAWVHTPRGGRKRDRLCHEPRRLGTTYVVGKGWGPHLELDTHGQPWIGYTAPEYAGGVIVAHMERAHRLLSSNRGRPRRPRNPARRPRTASASTAPADRSRCSIATSRSTATGRIGCVWTHGRCLDTAAAAVQ